MLLHYKNAGTVCIFEIALYQNKRFFKKRVNNLARKGRELEELVATLEKGLNGTRITVTSPDKIYDKVTKKKREIDITLKGNMGFHEMLTIIECRDRKPKDDVTWIEQLAIKKDHVGANLAIAVSSSGFTEGARIKADFLGIRLRTLAEIDPKEIMEWFQVRRITAFSLKWNFLKVDIAPYPSLDSSQSEELHKFLKSYSGSFRSNSKFIIDPQIDGAISIDDCILGNTDKIIEDFKPTDKKRTIQLYISPQNKEDGFFALTSDRLIRMEYIRIIMEIWLEFQEADIVSASSYDNEKNPLAQIISFEDIEIGGVNRSFKIHLTMRDDMQSLEFHSKDLD